MQYAVRNWNLVLQSARRPCGFMKFLGGNVVIEEVLGRVSAGEDLSMAEMADTIGSIMQGEWGDAQIAVLLTALRSKGETVAEVAGAAMAMRAHMTRLASTRPDLIDTCGPGGDGSGTFNISTAAAFVIAGCGLPVAKHGNRSITSKTGSADVLAALGIQIEAPVQVVERCLDEIGICFCFAPLLHPSMKNVGAVRKKLGVPTIFNLLGPLCNPASAPFQLLGVGRPEICHLLAEALSLLGTERALIVTGEDGLDEVTLAGATHVLEVRDGKISDFTWRPDVFGLTEGSLEELRVENAEQSAAMIREALSGRIGRARDIVIANAAAALWVADAAPTPRVCAARAAAAIDDGSATEILARLAERTSA